MKTVVLLASALCLAALPAVAAPSRETTCRAAGEVYARSAATTMKTVEDRVSPDMPRDHPLLAVFIRMAEKSQARADALLKRYGSAPKSQAEIDRLYKTPGNELDALATDCLI